MTVKNNIQKYNRALYIPIFVVGFVISNFLVRKDRMNDLNSIYAQIII